MKRRIPGYLVISAFAGLTVVSSTGCLPVFHVPDTAALEEYYSQGVSAEDLALVKPCVMATRESGEQEVRLAEGSAQTALRENIELDLDLDRGKRSEGVLAPSETVRSLVQERGKAIAFLHVSDAHIRDQAVCTPDYEVSLRTSSEALKMVGEAGAADSYRRPRLVTKWAALRLAGFVTGAWKAGVPYVVHTGDLCDISLISEVRLGLMALSAAWTTQPADEHDSGPSRRAEPLTAPQAASERPPRILTVAGNHDGLFWGNLRLDYTDPRRETDGVIAANVKQAARLVFMREFYRIEPQSHHLGLTKSEFVLAHLWATNDGYGFKKSEFEQVRANSNSVPEAIGGNCATERQLREYVRGYALGRIADYWGPSSAPGDFGKTRPFPVSLDDWREEIGCDLRGRIGKDSPPEVQQTLTDKHYWTSGHREEGMVDPRQLIKTNSEPPSGAYYTIDMFPEGEGRRSTSGKIRAIVLDTRACHYGGKALLYRGGIDQVQVDWLGKRLKDARDEWQRTGAADDGLKGVIIFAHHPPDEEFFVPGWDANYCRAEVVEYMMFRRLLHEYSDIIVAYFCGHTHENLEYWLLDSASGKWNERWPKQPEPDKPKPDSAKQSPPDLQRALRVIQTGSTCDYPHVGRLVRVTLGAKPHEAEVSWRFVDLHAYDQGPTGVLRRALKEARLAADDLPEPTSRTTQEREYLDEVRARHRGWETRVGKEGVILDRKSREAGKQQAEGRAQPPRAKEPSGQAEAPPWAAKEWIRFGEEGD